MKPRIMSTKPTPRRHPIVTKLATVFLVPGQRRLRLAWRMMAFGLLLAGFQRLFLGLDIVLDTTTPAIIRSLASIFCTIFVACPLLDRRRYGDLGLATTKRWWLDLIFGAFIGAFLVGIIFLILWALGWLTIQGVWRPGETSNQLADSLVGWLGFILAASISEEILIRGYLLTNISEGARGCRLNRTWSVVTAWVVTSVLFGLLHLNNPNPSWASTLNLIIAGTFLALPYVLTGNLAMPIGIHIAWNLFMGPVFGLPVSGLSMNGASLLRVTVDGPFVWTGGAFGPEAGLLGSMAFAMGSICVLLWVLGMDGTLTIKRSLADPPPEATIPPTFDPPADS